VQATYELILLLEYSNIRRQGYPSSSILWVPHPEPFAVVIFTLHVKKICRSCFGILCLVRAPVIIHTPSTKLKPITPKSPVYQYINFVTLTLILIHSYDIIIAEKSNNPSIQIPLDFAILFTVIFSPLDKCNDYL